MHLYTYNAEISKHQPIVQMCTNAPLTQSTPKGSFEH